MIKFMSPVLQDHSPIYKLYRRCSKL